MYEYLATVLRVVDGDTMHLNVDLGFNIKFEMPVRLLGLNCPELNTDAGKVARQFVIDWLNTHALVEGIHSEDSWQVILHSYKDKQEKYGRYLGMILDTSSFGLSLNQALLDSGNAVVYPISLAPIPSNQDKASSPVD